MARVQSKGARRATTQPLPLSITTRRNRWKQEPIMSNIANICKTLAREQQETQHLRILELEPFDVSRDVKVLNDKSLQKQMQNLMQVESEAKSC